MCVCGCQRERERDYYREIRTKGNAAADSIVTGSRIDGCGATAVGCNVASWNVAATAGDCLTVLPQSRDRLRGLLAASTTGDGSCCWLNIHRKYHDIAGAYCAGPRHSRRQWPRGARDDYLFNFADEDRAAVRAPERNPTHDGGTADSDGLMSAGAHEYCQVYVTGNTDGDEDRRRRRWRLYQHGQTTTGEDGTTM